MTHSTSILFRQRPRLAAALVLILPPPIVLFFTIMGCLASPVPINNMGYLSLLDEVGRLRCHVSQSTVNSWRSELHVNTLTPQKARVLHLELGEYALAHDMHPDLALWHFREAARLSSPKSPDYGLAAYDCALALFYDDCYQDAASLFRKLLAKRSSLAGYDRRRCAVWLRQSEAAAGYHAANAKIGIPEESIYFKRTVPIRGYFPENPKLSHLCGASALATCLRSMKLPANPPYVSSRLRISGEGSRLKDVLSAVGKYGLIGRMITADDKSLALLPKPIIAWAERDHFVAVTAADKRGLSLTCSECGPWPGGNYRLSWRQWRAMETGTYIAVYKKDSFADKLYSALFSKSEKTALLQGTRIASAEGAIGIGSETANLMRMVEALSGHVILTLPLGSGGCGLKPNGLHKPPQICPAPMDPPTCGCPSKGGVTHPYFAPSHGDPVNLATGEEEYSPASDLVVYNPHGTAIVWSRIYDSLRGPDPMYESDDFGIGWSDPYNIGVYDPNTSLNPQLTLGQSGSLLSSGHDAPASGLTWDIVQGGVTIATSSASNGWSVSETMQQSGLDFTITPPSNAAVGTEYEVRYEISGYPYPFSGFFDTLATSTLPQGAKGEVPSNGSDSPGNGLSWDILLNGSAVATSANPNGWSAMIDEYNSNMLWVTPPEGTPTGSGYEARTQISNYPVKSATFTVIANRFIPQTGTKYVVFPNGSRVSFSASAIPTSAVPGVIRQVEAGVPMLMEWDWSASNAFGYFTLTLPDRSKWITTPLDKASDVTQNGTVIGWSAWFSLSQIVNRNGNALDFNYGAMMGADGFPVLSSILDDVSGKTLMAFVRGPDGSLQSVTDAYGRSVYYHIGSYNTVNVSPPYTQSYNELDQVSEIVASGTANPPSRYAYGYQDVSNLENQEEVPFLHTITTPSPTGTGTSTATINYDPNTDYVSSVIDANGNQRVYASVDNNHTGVAVESSTGVEVFGYTAAYDNNMNETGLVNANGSTIVTRVFSDPNDPFRPSSEKDGNNNTTSFTWDKYGNLLTETLPNGLLITNTWSYVNFALGELMEAQTGGLIPTTYAYYEPIGLLSSLSTPEPGHSGDGAAVTASYAYDSLGNLLTETDPGNNTVNQIVTTYNYTTDGGYNQPDALGQALTATDNLGETTHYRYDPQGNRISATDALGNETDTSYDIADNPLQITYPATGQTGNGHATSVYSWLYPGGPLTSVTQYDESGAQVRQTVYAYGPEGEVLSRSGDGESVSYAYDPMYHPISLADGNNNVTSFAYNSSGGVSQITYPKGDSVQFPSYDGDGNVLKRIDGNNVETDYA